MKALLNFIVKRAFDARLKKLGELRRHPDRAQRETFAFLMENAAKTTFGAEHKLNASISVKNFQARVPVRAYEQFYPWIERALNGEKDASWPGATQWFAKSSGTTNDVSKFIPITKENLQNCHFAAGKDMFALYLENRPDSRLFVGKCLTIGGSHEISRFNDRARTGDLSSVLIENLPLVYQMQRAPSRSVALMSDYEEKLAKMADVCARQKISSLAGVPSWTLILARQMLEKYNVKSLREIWPNLEAFFHGGVNFGPYREEFAQICGPEMGFMNIYNASEGYIGLQDDLASEGLLLLARHGVFYEFIRPEDAEEPHPPAWTVEDAPENEQLALVLSSTSGLWRYLIGDTVRVVSRQPFRIVITGRTKHFINAFGEEVVIENAEEAIAAACAATGAQVSDYTAAPVYLQGGEKGGHEWIIECETPPDNAEIFIAALDARLQEVNTDYKAKRSGGLALVLPKVHFAPKGAFYAWMKSRGKLGGQNKVPRLANERKYVEDMLSMLASQPKN